jgi:hypothetical protein
MFRGLATVFVSQMTRSTPSLTSHQVLDSHSREKFYSELRGSGKYANIVGIYRHNSSSERIGVFDKDLIAHLPPSLKWIAHNGMPSDHVFESTLFTLPSFLIRRRWL